MDHASIPRLMYIHSHGEIAAVVWYVRAYIYVCVQCEDRRTWRACCRVVRGWQTLFGVAYVVGGVRLAVGHPCGARSLAYHLTA